MEKRFLDLICCPNCKSELKYSKNELHCLKCEKKYKVINGIPVFIENVENKQYIHQRRFFDKEYSKEKKYNLEEWQIRYIERMKENFGSLISKSAYYLDIGSGKGYGPIEFAKIGLNCVGCDLSIEAVIRAKRISDANRIKNVFWVVCSAEELPFKNSKFDLFSSNAVLEHLPDDVKSIKEMSRVAKNKAIGYITVPIVYQSIWPFLWPINYVHDKRIGHLRRYNRKKFEEKLKSTGFKIVNEYFTGHLFKLFGIITKGNPKKIEEIDSKSEKIEYGSSNYSIVIRR